MTLSYAAFPYFDADFSSKFSFLRFSRDFSAYFRTFSMEIVPHYHTFSREIVVYFHAFPNSIRRLVAICADVCRKSMADFADKNKATHFGLPYLGRGSLSCINRCGLYNSVRHLGARLTDMLHIESTLCHFAQQKRHLRSVSYCMG